MTFAARPVLNLGSVLNSNFYDDVFLSQVGPTQATAAITFQTNGTVTGANYSQPNWFDPTTVGIGNSYWLFVNSPTVGIFSEGSVDTRESLSSSLFYRVTTIGASTIRTAEAEATYEIWDAATGGNQVGSGTIILYAEVDNSL